MKRDGDTIYVTKVYYDDQMRVLKEENIYDHELKSVYQYEYDQFGNLKKPFSSSTVFLVALCVGTLVINSFS